MAVVMTLGKRVALVGNLAGTTSTWYQDTGTFFLNRKASSGM